MSTIVTRSGKGSILTSAEVDANFTNLNTDKVESLADLDITETAATISALPARVAALEGGSATVVYNEDIVLGNSFGGQTARLVVTDIGDGTKVDLFIPVLTHATLSAVSSSNFIPAQYRPVATISAVGWDDVSVITALLLIAINTSGALFIQYRISFNDTVTLRTSTGAQYHLSWYIPD